MSDLLERCRLYAKYRTDCSKIHAGLYPHWSEQWQFGLTTDPETDEVTARFFDVQTRWEETIDDAYGYTFDEIKFSGKGKTSDDAMRALLECAEPDKPKGALFAFAEWVVWHDKDGDDE